MIHAKMADLCSVFTRITKMLTLFSDAKSHLAYEHTCGLSCYLVSFHFFPVIFSLSLSVYSCYFLSLGLICYLENDAGFTVWAREWNGPHKEYVVCWDEHGWWFYFTSFSPSLLKCLHCISMYIQMLLLQYQLGNFHKK